MSDERSMRERIARAICRQSDLDEGFSEEQVDSPAWMELDANYLKCADAVLAAMREPTLDQIEAFKRTGRSLAGSDLGEDEIIATIYTAMIDSATKGCGHG